MTDAIETSLQISFFIFLGSILGGVAVVVVSKGLRRNYLYLNVFCGGMLAGLLGFDLIPEVISSYPPMGIFTGICLGIFFMLLMGRYSHHTKHLQVEHLETLALLFMALLIHSIPTGIALGMNFHDSHFQDPLLLSAIIIHQVPEGMVLMVSVLYARVKIRTFWLLCLFLAIAIGVNTFIGITMHVHSLNIRTIFMGAAIGTLSYVTFYEILGKGLKRHLTIKMILAAIFGMGFLKLVHLFVPFSH